MTNHCEKHGPYEGYCQACSVPFEMARMRRRIAELESTLAPFVEWAKAHAAEVTIPADLRSFLHDDENCDDEGCPECKSQKATSDAERAALEAAYVVAGISWEETLQAAKKQSDLWYQQIKRGLEDGL